MAFGDHRIGVSNAQSIHINTQEGYTRLKNEAKAQNKELVFVGNFQVKIVPKRNIFEKITDFFNGELRAEKGALKSFKVSLPTIKQNAQSTKEALEGGGTRLENDFAVKSRRAARTFKETYAKHSEEGLAKDHIRATIRDRHEASRSDRTNKNLLRDGGILESAHVIKTQLKKQGGLKPSDFRLGKQLESIGEESEEEISEGISAQSESFSETTLQDREGFRNALLNVARNISGSSGTLSFQNEEYNFNEEQLDAANDIANELDDIDVDLERVFRKFEAAGIKLEGPLAAFSKTPEQLAELRPKDTIPTTTVFTTPSPQAPIGRKQELTEKIQHKLSVNLLSWGNLFPDTPREQLNQIKQLSEDIDDGKFLNADKSLKINELESALSQLGLTTESGLLQDAGEFINELKTNTGN